MFKTINFEGATNFNDIEEIMSSEIAIPGDGVSLSYGYNSDGSPTPVFISISQTHAELHQNAVNSIIYSNNSKPVYVTLFIKKYNSNSSANMGDSYYLITHGIVNQYDTQNILATNLPDGFTVTGTEQENMFMKVKEYVIDLSPNKNSHVLFTDGSGNWYRAGQGTKTTIAPITTAEKSEIKTRDIALPTLSFSLSSAQAAQNRATTNTTSINSLRQSYNSMNNTITGLFSKDTELLNKINANTAEIDRVEEIVSDIDIEAIRTELQTEINEVNTAIGALDSLVDDKVTQLNSQITQAENTLQEKIVDAEEDLNGIVDSFNESFSQEITETKAQLQTQLQDAITDLRVLENDVNERITSIRETVDSIVDDVEGTMRHVVTNISLTR